MKQYHGIMRDGVPVVTVDRRPLVPRVDLTHLHGVSFDWQPGTDGALQLAASLIADVIGDDDATADHYRQFAEVIERLPREGWTLTERHVAEAVGAIEPRGR